jgi:hypothetical protein
VCVCGGGGGGVYVSTRCHHISSFRNADMRDTGEKVQKFTNLIFTASSIILTSVIPVNTRFYSHASIKLCIPNMFLPEKRAPCTHCMGPKLICMWWWHRKEYLSLMGTETWSSSTKPVSVLVNYFGR